MVDLSDKKILVVDDDPDTLMFIGVVLSDAGATVIEAEDGVEALELARREKPDLVTLDLTMPRKSGLEVYEEMRRDDELRDIPVCIVSGQPELRKLIYQRVVPVPDGYLDKPIHEDDLLLSVRKILRLAAKRAR
jgi:twitching motility two-component system response regulator PilH